MSHSSLLFSDALPDAIITLPHTDWATPSESAVDAIDALEQGKVLFLPQLAFSLSAEEISLLTPTLVDPKRKNISYQPQHDKLSGIANDVHNQSDIAAVRALLQRHYQQCQQLIDHLLPAYRDHLHSPTNSLRLHPIAAWKAGNSWRKDDTRLHIDAFPSRPNHGERILRIFTNINPRGESRVWRVGEPFPALAQRFVPLCKRYHPLTCWLQNKVGITKTYRSHYDHLMLQLHDAMKGDPDYQEAGLQRQIAFPAGSSWICFSDQTAHAAMSGQFMLEQTFLLPVKAMKTPLHAPLQILETLLHKPLV